MPFYIAGFVFGRLFAQQRGIVDQSSLNRVALVGGVVGPSPTGLILTSVVANREAESIPPPLVDLPDVRNKLVADARKQLEDVGLVVEVLEKLNIDNPEIVIDQNPKPPSQVEPGSTVTLTVNKQGVSVPDVLCLPFDPDAVKKFRDVGLGVDRKNEGSNCIDLGSVFETDPRRTTVVEPKSNVTVFVSSGPGSGISKRPPAPAR
jgi:hypothetical protein